MGFVRIFAAVLLFGLAVAPALGGQAMLLEQEGDTGVKQIAGTVEWRQTLDPNGEPGLTAIATIPGGNLAAEVTLTPNDDPALPAQHLFTVTFVPGEGFAGKSIVELAGVMMRNGSDMQGTPMAGAAARIVVNSFLFAPSDDAGANADKLDDGVWMDLALVFETGQRAIFALEIDATAREQLAAMAL